MSTSINIANETRKLFEAGRIDEALALYKSDPSAVQPHASRREFVEGMKRLLALRNQNLAAELLHGEINQ